VVALGSVPRTFPVPGLTEHGRGFKDLADAIALRNHVLRELDAADTELDKSEAARRLSFLFVGAGYAGVPLLTRKLHVVADWTTSLFFRRDVAELSMLGHPRRLDDGRSAGP
jgi:NADH dehydrogenase